MQSLLFRCNIDRLRREPVSSLRKGCWTGPRCGRTVSLIMLQTKSTRTRLHCTYIKAKGRNRISTYGESRPTCEVHSFFSTWGDGRIDLVRLALIYLGRFCFTRHLPFQAIQLGRTDDQLSFFPPSFLSKARSFSIYSQSQISFPRPFLGPAHFDLLQI